MTTAGNQLSKAETVLMAAIEAAVPMLVHTRDLIDRFHAMVRKRIASGLEQSLLGAEASLIASFTNGIRRDHAVVRAAIAEPRQTARPKGRSQSSSR